MWRSGYIYRFLAKSSFSNSALTVFLTWSGAEATRPDLGKKTAIICLEVLLNLLNFTGGLSPGKSYAEDCCMVLCHTGTQKSCHPWWCPWPDVTCLHQIFEACEGTTPPYSSFVPRSAGGALNMCNISENPVEGGSDLSFLMKDSTALYLIFCNLWVFFVQTLNSGHVLFDSNG